MTKKLNYKAWKVSKTDFPVSGTLEQKIHFLAQYGVLAPSTHNTQPWLISINDHQMIIRPDYSKEVNVADPNGTGLLISIGAFAENVTQAAEAFGLSVQVKIYDDKIVLNFKEKKQAAHKVHKVNAIIERRSNKFQYTSGNKLKHRRLTNKLIAFENQNLKVVHTDSQKNETMKLHLSAAREAMHDKKFVHEVSKWLRSNSTKKYDGMPGFVISHSTIKTSAGRYLARTLKKLPPNVLGYEKKLLESTPFFVIIGSNSKQPRDFIRAGILVQRFWLAITEDGLVAQPLFAMIKSEKYMVKLKKSVGMSTEPVFFFRVGLPTVVAEHTPRRPYQWN